MYLPPKLSTNSASGWNLRLSGGAADPSNGRGDGLSARLRIPHRALPDRKDPPAFANQQCHLPPIAGPIAAKLLEPKRPSGARNDRQRTPGMPVPEAAVYEYDRRIFWQDDVWSPRQVPSMEAISKPNLVQPSPEQTLRCRVHLTNARHVSAASLCRQAVNHRREPTAGLTTPKTLWATKIASSGGTALPTWWYCSVRVPQNR